MDDIPECELGKDITPELLTKYGPKYWMVRNCEWYWEEYKECSRFLGRVHQYFIFGHSIDCSNWKRDYDLCMNFRKNKDKTTLDTLVANEEERVQQRLQQSFQNNVWKYRTEPPADWDKFVPKPSTLRASPLAMYEQERQNKESV